MSDLVGGAKAGNITHKSDIGDYHYNDPTQQRPHTPHSITGIRTNANNQDKTYQYDANGNMTQNGDKHITWTSHNKPKQFTKGSDTTNFTYAPDRTRYQKTQTTTNNNTLITTTYLGKIYEQITQHQQTQHKHYIYMGGKLITIHTKTEAKPSAKQQAATTASNNNPTPDQTRYLHYDNLGSIDTITDGQGNIVERMSYTPFGQRRQGDWRANQNPHLPIIPKLTNRGFTGHEHIDEMNLIHMNGRVYDPTIGRFLSPDPHIQDPHNTQSYNRYTYVLNNPLKYTDPSGYFFSAIISAFVASVATKSIIAAVGAKLFLAKVAIAYITAYTVTYATTGSGKAAQNAGLSAGLFMGIGELRGGTIGANGKMQYKPGWGDGQWKTLSAHGLAGGIVQHQAGGKFSAGFLSGFTSSYFGSSVPSGGDSAKLITNTITDAIIGGTVSVLGGGKFRNGARTSAFRYLFNEWMHAAEKLHHRHERQIAGQEIRTVEQEWDEFALEDAPKEIKKIANVLRVARPSIGVQKYTQYYYHKYRDVEYDVYGYYRNDGSFKATTHRFNVEDSYTTDSKPYLELHGKNHRACISLLCYYP